MTYGEKSRQCASLVHCTANGGEGSSAAVLVGGVLKTSPESACGLGALMTSVESIEEPINALVPRRSFRWGVLVLDWCGSPLLILLGLLVLLWRLGILLWRLGILC